MAGNNLLGRCDKCCTPDEPCKEMAVGVSFESRFTDGAFLEGFHPFVASTPCVRYRRYTYNYVIDHRDENPPDPSSCDGLGDCDEGGGFTQYDETGTGYVDWDGSSSCPRHRQAENCLGVYLDETDESCVGYPFSLTVPPYDPPTAKTARLYISAQTDCVLGVSNFRLYQETYEWTLTNPDTWEAARARVPYPTIGTQSCAFTSPAPLACSEDETQTVKITFTVTGPPSTECQLAVYLETRCWDWTLSGAPLNYGRGALLSTTPEEYIIAFTTDVDGNWELEWDMPQPERGCETCYLGVQVLNAP
jgi:hypothetical protein